MSDQLADQYDAALTRIENLETLLRRIRQWDVMDGTSDGPYWRAEIDKALR